MVTLTALFSILSSCPFPSLLEPSCYVFWSSRCDLGPSTHCRRKAWWPANHCSACSMGAI